MLQLPALLLSLAWSPAIWLSLTCSHTSEPAATSGQHSFSFYAKCWVTILFVTEDYCATWICYVKKAKKMSTHDGRGHLQSTPHFNGTVLLTLLSVNEVTQDSSFTLALLHVFKLFFYKCFI